MFQKKLYVSGNSYVEVSTRVYDGEERIMLTICGPKDEKQTVVASAILTDQHAALLSTYLDDAVSREKNWPPEEENQTED